MKGASHVMGSSSSSTSPLEKNKGVFLFVFPFFPLVIFSLGGVLGTTSSIIERTGKLSANAQ